MSQPSPNGISIRSRRSAVFCTAYPHTDTPTTLRETFVAAGRISCSARRRCMRPNSRGLVIIITRQLRQQAVHGIGPISTNVTRSVVGVSV